MSPQALVALLFAGHTAPIEAGATAALPNTAAPYAGSLAVRANTQTPQTVQSTKGKKGKSHKKDKKRKAQGEEQS